MNIWWLMLAGGLVTFATRLSFILLIGRKEPPEAARRALRFIPPAVLSAIIFPELLLPGGVLNLSPGNPRLLAGLAAMLVAWRTRSAVLTIAAGMLVLWGLSLLGMTP